LRSYSAWLHLSLLCVGFPAVVFAWLGWHLLIESQYRLERGRIASDILAALTNFELDKARLRTWSYQSVTAVPPAPEKRLQLLSDMTLQASLISEKTQTAITLDQQRGKFLQEHQDRERLLLLLNSLVDELTRETAQLLDNAPGNPGRPQMTNPRSLSEDDETLANALSSARRNEAILLSEERVRADDSLLAAQRLFLSAGASLGILTLFLAIVLSKRLRTPLQQLSQGVRSFQAGDFSYRLGHFRDKEFANFAELLNAMATEVQHARERATEQRVHLESVVADRTADLRAALDDISAAEAARKQLLVDIGHELRTPITVLQGEAQVALRANETDSQFYRETLGRIVKSTRQMGSLIEDLVEVVRNPEFQMELSVREVSVQSVMAAVLEVAQGLGASRDVTVECPDSIPQVMLTTDPDRLRQVLVCLADNAIRYSHEGGSVTIDCTVAADRLLSIRVIDAGIGIDEPDIASIWTRGWRARAARAHRPEGLGLGLAIARQLTEALGGTITIRSQGESRGTTATLQLPLA
jgi:two-component system, OmpR family, sensor kinase